MRAVDEMYDPAEYMRCSKCGVLVEKRFGLQTGYRCLECWKDSNTMNVVEVINSGARQHVNNSKKRSKPAPGPHNKHNRHMSLQARQAADMRLRNVLPEVWAMLYDEERVSRGMPPAVRYDPLDFEKEASKTLGFDGVYDALRSSGADECVSGEAETVQTARNPQISPPKPST